MNNTLDGEFQKFSVSDGAYIRKHFFGPDPRLRKIVEHLTDDDLTKLRRGGHDYRKVYAAYKAAVSSQARRRRSSPTRSRAGRWAPASRPATSPTRRRSCPKPSCGTSATASSCRSPTPRSRTRAVLPPRARSPRRSSTCASGARRSAARSRSGSSATSRCPPPRRPWTPSSPAARESRLDDDGLHPPAAQPDPRPGVASGSCRSSPTRRARSAWTRSSRRSASTPRRPALRAGRLEPRAQLPRGDRRPGPRGGHHRGRLDGQPPGRRDAPTRATAWR